MLTGLLNKEVSYTTETTIERPLDLVWEKFNDSDITKEYIPQILEITPMKELPGVVGSTTKIKMGGSRPMDIIETVKAYEEKKLIDLEFDAEGMIKRDTYTFTELKGKTKMTATHSIIGEGIMTRAIYRMMKRLFKNTDQGFQNTFKDIVEERF